MSPALISVLTGFALIAAYVAINALFPRKRSRARGK